MINRKRGISPVIATSLLVLLALVLSIIIFFWARTLIKEKLQKDLGGGPQDVDLVCDQIVFKADILAKSDTLQISLENSGNIPIFGAQIMYEKDGSRKNLGNVNVSLIDQSLMAGQSAAFTLKSSTLTFAQGDQFKVIPILLGKNSNGDVKQHVCDESKGINVGAI